MPRDARAPTGTREARHYSEPGKADELDATKPCPRRGQAISRDAGGIVNGNPTKLVEIMPVGATPLFFDETL